MSKEMRIPRYDRRAERYVIGFCLLTIIETVLKVEQLLFIMVVLLLYSRKKNRAYLFFGESNLMLPLIAFLAYASITMFWSPAGSACLSTVFVNFAMCTLLLTQLQFSYDRNKMENRLPILLMIQAICFTIYCFTFSTTYWDGRLVLKGIGNSGGTDPNTISCWLSFPLVYACSGLLDKKYRCLRKLLCATTLILSLWLLFRCNSRGGIIGNLVGLMVYVWSKIITTAKQDGRRALWIIAIVLAGSLVLCLSIPQQVWGRFSLAEKDSLNGRGDIWNELVTQLIENKHLILIGAGMDSVPFYNKGMHVAHNIYLKFFFQYGIIGFGLFMFFVGTLIRRVIKAKRFEVLAGFISILVISLSLDSDTYRPLWLAFFYCALQFKPVEVYTYEATTIIQSVAYDSHTSI